MVLLSTLPEFINSVYMNVTLSYAKVLDFILR